ncbi:MAG: nickel pincer cofactor biosynthesis protein LarC [Sphaerochaeta sp.]
MKSLYLECLSGVSGDMLVGSLIDLGADVEMLKDVLSQLKSDEFKIKIERLDVLSIDTCSFDVLYGDALEAERIGSDLDVIEKTKSEESHSHEHLHDDQHSHSHSHEHHHSHSHDENHTHEHSHDEQHHHSHGEQHAHHHHHVHRNLNDIFVMLDGLKIDDEVKIFAKDAFTVVAEAEAKAHGLPVEEVHFHEVGAIDSIVDILSFSVLYHSLNIDKVYVSDIYEGSGHVLCQHGLLPIPVPAVANICSANSLPLVLTKLEGEMVTPTGAALIATLKPTFDTPSLKGLKKIGLGSGKRYTDRANYVRAMIIEEDELSLSDSIIKMETNIDDCSGEELGYTLDLLFEAGALDVFYTPIYMKKNRPAYILSLIIRPEDRALMEKIIFTNTSSIGIRYTKMERTILDRKKCYVDTKYGKILAKECSFSGIKRVYPEYESVVSAAASYGVSYKEVYNCVISKINLESN